MYVKLADRSALGNRESSPKTPWSAILQSQLLAVSVTPANEVKKWHELSEPRPLEIMAGNVMSCFRATREPDI